MVFLHVCLIGPAFLENSHFFGTLVKNHFAVSERLFLDTVLADRLTVTILSVHSLKLPTVKTLRSVIFHSRFTSSEPFGFTYQFRINLLGFTKERVKWK